MRLLGINFLLWPVSYELRTAVPHADEVCTGKGGQASMTEDL
jgi:hypothetical protein